MVRAFIAIELSESIQTSIRQFQQQLQTNLQHAPIRWVLVENIHLTLKFLGDINQDRIKTILTFLDELTDGIPYLELNIRRLGCFPRCQRPRVLWLGIEEEAGHLNILQRRIEDSLRELGFEPERRRFHPHLTLGRVKKSARPDQVTSIARQLGDYQQPEIGVQRVEAVHLIRSHLTPSGAEYSDLGTARLGEGL